MEPQEKLTTQQFIIDRLHDIQRKVEASNYPDALSSMKEVKAADVKNIYLIALEKQITKLTDASLQPENRTEIIKSLPAMIERAISDVQRRSTTPKVDEGQKGQKEAALEKLKSQYFQRADDYVEKQEYTRALEEIRRIYIIEPGSVVAKEYEQKIEQLAALHARGETESPEPVSVEEKEATTPDIEVPKEKYILEEEPKKSKLPIIAAAAVVILAVGAWFLFSNKESATKPANQGLDQPQTLTQESEIQTPSLPTTTTSTPQYGENDSKPAPTTPAPETNKQPEKVVKAKPEAKPPAQESKPVQTPARTTTTSKQPARTQQQITQPAATPQQQQVTQPAPVQQQPAQQQPAQQQPKVAESTPAPMPFVAIESAPELVRREPAQYPEIAIKMGIQGKVFVEVTVDAQGKPIQAKVVKTTSDIFDDSAIEAAMKSTYKPAMMSTGPVTAKVVVPFVFNIKR